MDPNTFFDSNGTNDHEQSLVPFRSFPCSLEGVKTRKMSRPFATLMTINRRTSYQVFIDATAYKMYQALRCLSHSNSLASSINNPSLPGPEDSGKGESQSAKRGVENMALPPAILDDREQQGQRSSTPCGVIVPLAQMDHCWEHTETSLSCCSTTSCENGGACCGKKVFPYLEDFGASHTDKKSVGRGAAAGMATSERVAHTAMRPTTSTYIYKKRGSMSPHFTHLERKEFKNRFDRL